MGGWYPGGMPRRPSVDADRASSPIGASPVPAAGDDAALSLAEAVCLALADTGATHGWSIVKELEPGAEIGAVWSLSRQLTYRAVDQLVAKGLIERQGRAPGRGQGKVILRVTPQGRRLVARWLATPVAHVRDVRTEGLLKLLLRRRAGLDNAPFLRLQQATLEPIFARLADAGRDPADLPGLLRREQARAVQRFLVAAAGSAGQG